jgi:hypothetical protein
MIFNEIGLRRVRVAAIDRPTCSWGIHAFFSPLPEPERAARTSNAIHKVRRSYEHLDPARGRIADAADSASA